jgi:hypothetical protein
MAKIITEKDYMKGKLKVIFKSKPSILRPDKVHVEFEVLEHDESLMTKTIKERDRLYFRHDGRDIIRSYGDSRLESSRLYIKCGRIPRTDKAHNDVMSKVVYNRLLAAFKYFGATVITGKKKRILLNGVDISTQKKEVAATPKKKDGFEGAIISDECKPLIDEFLALKAPILPDNGKIVIASTPTEPMFIEPRPYNTDVVKALADAADKTIIHDIWDEVPF